MGALTETEKARQSVTSQEVLWNTVTSCWDAVFKTKRGDIPNTNEISLKFPDIFQRFMIHSPKGENITFLFRKFKIHGHSKTQQRTQLSLLSSTDARFVLSLSVPSPEACTPFAPLFPRPRESIRGHVRIQHGCRISEGTVNSPWGIRVRSGRQLLPSLSFSEPAWFSAGAPLSSCTLLIAAACSLDPAVEWQLHSQRHLFVKWHVSVQLRP